MSAPINNTKQLKDVIDAVQNAFKYVLSQAKMIGLLVVVCGIGAFLYALTQSPKYDATTTFVLEEKTSSGGGLAGIASQFGVDLGSMSGAGAGLFSGDNILDIVKSRVILERVLLSKVDSTKGTQSPTLADLYLDFTGLRKGLAKKSAELGAIRFNDKNGNTNFTVQEDSVLFAICSNLTKNSISVDRLNKKGSIFKITTVTDNQVFSKNCTERLLLETTKYYVNIKTNNATANVQRLQKKADSLYAVLNAKSYSAASYQILDANAAYKTMTVPGELTQRDKNVVFGIYGEVIKNLEMSKMALVSQTPIIQILDMPKFPLIDQRKSVLFITVLGILAGIFIGVVLAVYQYTDK